MASSEAYPKPPPGPKGRRVQSGYNREPVPAPYVLILTALPMESRAILRSLARDRSTIAVDVRSIGMRAVHLARRVPLSPLLQHPPKVILVAGVAGGLDPSLHVGDVVVDGELLDLPPLQSPPGQPPVRPFFELSPLPAYREREKAPHPTTLPPLCVGQIHTADVIVSSAADKARLFASTGALAVDMEQQLVRGYFSGCGARIIGIRAISDPAYLSLPDELAAWLTPSGRPRLLRITRDFVRRPRLISPMSNLRRNMKRALQSLGMTVAQVVATIDASVETQ